MKLIFYLETLDIGGAQINAINLGKALVDRGHQIWLVSDKGPLVSRVVSSGMNFVQIPYLPNRRPDIFRIPKLISISKIHSVDLIQAFEYHSILEAHTASFLSGKPMYGIAAMYPLRTHFRFPKSRQIGLVNPDSKEQLIRNYGWDRDKVDLIVARLDCDYYHPYDNGDKNILSSHGIPKKEKTVILVTRVDHVKWPTIALFLKASEHWAHTRSGRLPIRFVVVGGGPKLNTLREHASKLPHGNMISTGELLDIPSVMNEADVILGMASTCQQGLACEKPTIVIGNHGYSAVINPENFDFLAHHHFNLHTQVKNDQPEMLCQQIEETLSSSKRLQELKRFGRSIALEKFDSHIGARQLEGIYERLIANNNSSAIRMTAYYRDSLIYLISFFWFRLKRYLKRVLAWKIQ